MKRVAINGFGRIGRLTFRHLMDKPDIEVVALNDVAPLENLVYLLKHDSVYSSPEVEITADDSTLNWAGKKSYFLQVPDPANLPWFEMDVDIVIEASGRFTRKEDAEKHLKAGAKYVMVTAPVKGDVPTFCLGVNEDEFDPSRHKVVSNASCTTNALAPVAKVLNDNFGIVSGFLTTVHAVTSSQAVVDVPNEKMRRGRSALGSIVPTTTGAATATSLVLPELKGKLGGIAMRVPVICGSVIDLVVETERPVTAREVNEALVDASKSERMRNILAVSDEELVSADIIGTRFSSVVDGPSTMVIKETMVKVLAWYDNEWAYALRVADMAELMLSRIEEPITGGKRK